MAACCQQPAADYFSAAEPKAKQHSIFATSPYLWEQSPYTPSHDSYDTSESTLPSPIVNVHPNLYTLPEGQQYPKTEASFDLGTFSDWVGWDDPTETTFSPTTIDFFPELKMPSDSGNIQQREVEEGEQPQYQNVAMANGIEESSAAFGDDQGDQPFFVQSDQPREDLYSTPLSWSPPTPNIKTEVYPMAVPLTAQQQSKLIAQAMPSRSRTYPSSPSSIDSPEHEYNSLKRKSTTKVSDDEEEFHTSHSATKRHPPIKKTAHNMIEKRYRTKLNEKIAILRDSVPSLRVVTKTNSKGEEIEEDLQGLTPAHKLDKATVLSKATEYIAHLEQRNRALYKENTTLKSRVEAFEILMMAQKPEQQRRAMDQQLVGTKSRKESISRYELNGIIS